MASTDDHANQYPKVAIGPASDPRGVAHARRAAENGGRGIPVVVACYCGGETRVNAGDALVCARCGKRKETARATSGKIRGAGAAAVRHKIMTRLGIGVIG